MDDETQDKSGDLQQPSEDTVRAILSLGHASLVFTLILFLFLSWLDRDDPESPYGRIWALILAHVFLGRAGNAGVGLELGFHPVFLMYQAFVQDFVVMCYLYPVFVKGHGLLKGIPGIGKYVLRLNESALRRRKQIRPFGVAGLFLFVAFPFWSTGPIVGVLVGHLLGLRAVTTFTTVVVADALVTGAWMWAYDSLRETNKSLAYAILGGVFIVAFCSLLLARIRKRKQQQAIGE